MQDHASRQAPRSCADPEECATAHRGSRQTPRSCADPDESLFDAIGNLDQSPVGDRIASGELAVVTRLLFR